MRCLTGYFPLQDQLHLIMPEHLPELVDQCGSGQKTSD